MKISRRAFVRYGVGGALLLMAGGAGLALQPTKPRRSPRRLFALDPRSFAILSAVVGRMVPESDDFPRHESLGVAEKIDEFLASCHPSVVREFRQVLGLVENGLAGFLLDGRPGAFTSLSPEMQDRALASWRTSSWKFRRTVYQALHGLCMAVYYSSPEVYPSLGYPGPPPLGVNGVAR